MMYTRASASDYDDWKTMYENPGWGSDDLIPLLKKVGVLCLNLAIHCTHAHAVVVLPPRRPRRIKFLAPGQRMALTAR